MNFQTFPQLKLLTPTKACHAFFYKELIFQLLLVRESKISLCISHYIKFFPKIRNFLWCNAGNTGRNVLSLRHFDGANWRDRVTTFYDDRFNNIHDVQVIYPDI
jgi:hypothetical protein